jgi:hypothetical protein
VAYRRPWTVASGEAVGNEAVIGRLAPAAVTLLGHLTLRFMGQGRKGEAAVGKAHLVDCCEQRGCR